jgi:hypothetical protein
MEPWWVKECLLDSRLLSRPEAYADRIRAGSCLEQEVNDATATRRW